jgi:protein ImuA
MAAQGLIALRREIAAIEGTSACLDEGRPQQLALDVPAIDAALGGGLARGAVHALRPAAPVHRGAAFGFALALAGHASRHAHGHVVWIETPFAAAETGRPYAGLESFGLALARVLVVRVPRVLDVLWVMEEALTCRGIAAVIAELTQDVDLTASRRLALAARESGGLGLLVHHRVSPQPNAAMTRWRIAAAPSRPDAYGGLGPAAFDLSLTKNRLGPCGRWTILWDHHERAFQALPVGVAPASRDRPARLLRTA